MSSMTRSGLRPERSGGGGKAADEGGILGAFEQIAGGIVADVHQQVGSRDARGKGAGRVVALAVGAAIDVRGRGEIGRADVVAAALLADQRFDARAVGAGRGAEDARESAWRRGGPQPADSRRRSRRARRPPSPRHRAARSAPGTDRGTGRRCARSRRPAGGRSRRTAAPRRRARGRWRGPRSAGSPSAPGPARSPRRRCARSRCPTGRSPARAASRRGSAYSRGSPRRRRAVPNPSRSASARCADRR